MCVCVCRFCLRTNPERAQVCCGHCLLPSRRLSCRRNLCHDWRDWRDHARAAVSVATADLPPTLSPLPPPPSLPRSELLQWVLWVQGQVLKRQSQGLPILHSLSQFTGTAVACAAHVALTLVYMYIHVYAEVPRHQLSSVQASVIKQTGRVAAPEVEPPLFYQPGKAGFYSVVQAAPSVERLQAFRSVGRMIGLGLLLAEVLPLPLCRHVLKFIMMQEVGLVGTTQCVYSWLHVPCCAGCVA